MPPHAITDHGERHLLLCTELWLGECGAGQILNCSQTAVCPAMNGDPIGPFRPSFGGALTGRRAA